MKQFGGWFFPQHEEHLPWWLEQNGVDVQGRLAYQWKKISAALKYVSRWRTAIDVGGHVGLWSFYLASRFNRVIAYEPVAEHRACFDLNVLRACLNVHLVPCALGAPEDDNATVAIYTRPGSSGDSWVKGRGDIPLRRMDHSVRAEGLHAWGDDISEQIDFIKLDCEGYELFALQGGEQLLKANSPTIIVEQKPGKAKNFGIGETDAVSYLESLGYRVREHLSGDYILTV
jgi:FkbM family methyltransferase